MSLVVFKLLTPQTLLELNWNFNLLIKIVTFVSLIVYF